MRNGFVGIMSTSDLNDFLQKYFLNLPSPLVPNDVLHEREDLLELAIAKPKTDLKKIKQGDVLVATMTRQDFVPAMRKAVAIITDEGGVTCHAAIIARKLGIPCLVNTQIATKVLHDGDLVEVDAEKGMVKKI